MSSTNKTTNYNLSQFVGTDVPSYLGDYNSDMSKIDKAIGDVANSQGSVEQSVVGLTAEVQGLSTQVDGVSTSVQQVQTSIAQIDTAYKQADAALNQRITANANNIQANNTAIENNNTAIESINTTIGTEDISGIGDGTIKGAIGSINSSLSGLSEWKKETIASFDYGRLDANYNEFLHLVSIRFYGNDNNTPNSTITVDTRFIPQNEVDPFAVMSDGVRMECINNKIHLTFNGGKWASAYFTYSYK